jgi:hypothetical protein
MKQLIVLAVAAAAVALAGATPARAQANTTFVSGHGADTNPCTLPAPCRSFARAVLVTNAGGQITMLDPAGYGVVTITRAISIVNDGGGETGINDATAGVDAITINAGASDVVNLRGLTLNGVGIGHNGITFNSGGTLNVQDCVIRSFKGFGIGFAPGTSAAITVADTVLSNDSGGGIAIAPSNGTTTASLERVTAVGSDVAGFSLVPTGTGVIQGTITDSAAIGNRTGNGFSLNSGAAAAVIALINSKAIGNATGVLAGTGTIVMSRVTLAGNTVNGFSSVSLESFGDNYIIDTTNSGVVSPIALQ